MVQPHQLQIDLHVTRDDGSKAPATRNYFTESDSNFTHESSDPFSPPEHAPPSLPFARRPQHDRTRSTDSLASEYSENTETVDNSVRATALYAELDDTFDSPADLAVFDGERDEPVPAADLELSARIEKAGLERRRESRPDNVGKRRGASQLAPGGAKQSMIARESKESAFLSPLASSAFPIRSSSHQYPPRASSLSPAPSPARSQMSHSYSTDSFDNRPLDSAPHNDSTAFLHQPARSSEIYQGHADVDLEQRGGGKRDEDVVALDVTEEDEDDLDAVAILARRGHPSLDKVLDDEFDRAEGKIIVACTSCSQ